MSRTHVPPEIINHVFSFLQSDPTTLVLCSRVHPILSPIAERFLYADVVVFDNHKNEDNSGYNPRKDGRRRCFMASELHQLLIDSPHVANYIRKLEICLFSMVAAGIAPILPMLMQLDGIFVTTNSIYRLWASVSEEFCNAFVNRLSSPLSVLTEVSIIYFDYLPLHILFDNCKTVKRIGLHSRTWTEGEVVPHVLDSLSLYSWRPVPDQDPRFMDWAKRHIHSLRFLLFHSSNHESINKVLPELLGMCSNSLTSLEVNLSDGGGPTAVDLSCVPHLKDLTIRSNLHNWYSGKEGYPYQCAVFTIIHLLETASSLDNLTLEINNCLFSDQVVFKSVDWSPFLTLFSHSEHKFRHIELQLCYTTSKTGPFMPSVDTIPELYGSEIVSDLMAKGVLSIRTKEFKLY